MLLGSTTQLNEKSVEIRIERFKSTTDLTIASLDRNLTKRRRDAPVYSHCCCAYSDKHQLNCGAEKL